MAKIKLHPIPGAFIPGVPTEVQEFETQAEADRFLKGETGGIKHASAFTATKADANEAAPIEPDKGNK
jgi:hypothetical protein